MKQISIRLLSELMKNSKTSDRELAGKLGVSQPTVSRVRARLEREGYVRSYTMMPDFLKLGFQIMALTFVKLKKPLSKGEIVKIRKFADDLLTKAPFALLMASEGIGCDADRVLITLHEDYSSYVEFVKIAKQSPFADLYGVDSFKIDLVSGEHYQPLTFSGVANYILRTRR